MIGWKRYWADFFFFFFSQFNVVSGLLIQSQELYIDLYYNHILLEFDDEINQLGFFFFFIYIKLSFDERWRWGNIMERIIRNKIIFRNLWHVRVTSISLPYFCVCVCVKHWENVRWISSYFWQNEYMFGIFSWNKKKIKKKEKKTYFHKKSLERNKAQMSGDVVVNSPSKNSVRVCVFVIVWI